MKRYLKAIFGGFLAIVTAFGWTVTMAYAAEWKYGSFLISGVRIGYALWIVLFLIFSAGFYLAFRAAYSKNSN